MILELHIIQNFAPSNLNRGDTGSPKDCTFGGFRRARISSQCFKRAMREHFNKSKILTNDGTAYRSKRLHEKLYDLVNEKEQDFPDLEYCIEGILAMNGIYLVEKLETDDANEPSSTYWVGKSESLAFLGKDTLNQIAELISKNRDAVISAGEVFKKYRENKRNGKGYKGDVSKDDKSELRAKVKKVLGKELAAEIEKALDGSRASDLALFGRMLADLPEKNRNASSQVAHAISTHKVGVEFDFYTAVDDLKPDDTSGADMLGVIEFNSACFYRYLNVDVSELQKNLQSDDELTKATVETFIRSAIDALPTGKQNSFATHEKPSFVLAVVRDSGMCSLANAFEKPARATERKGLVENSVEKLDEYWQKLTTVYGDSSKGKSYVNISDAELKGLNGAKVDNFETLVTKTINAIFG